MVPTYVTIEAKPTAVTRAEIEAAVRFTAFMLSRDNQDTLRAIDSEGCFESNSLHS